MVACAKTVSGLVLFFLVLGTAVPSLIKEVITGLFAGSCAACAGITASPGDSNAGTMSPAPIGPGTLSTPVEYLLLCGIPPPFPPLPTGPVNPNCEAIAL